MAFLFFVIGLFDFKCRLVAYIERRMTEVSNRLSISFLVLFATLPPSLATATFSRKVSGCLLLDNAVVVASSVFMRTHFQSVTICNQLASFFF